MRWAGLVVLLVLSGCDPGPDAADVLAPQSATALHAWLRAGEYAQWSDVDDVVANDTGVTARIFLSPRLADSLADEAITHPRGAAAVREIYEPDGTTLRGWAAAVKLIDTREPSADAWLWLEVFGTHAHDQPQVAATGAPTCIGCHTKDARDFIHTESR